MCISSVARASGRRSAGFTALELLVGIALTVLLALGVAPLVLSLQAAEVQEADRTVMMMQGRVAAARLERDLRMASAFGSSFSAEGPILEATPRQVVFVGRTGGKSGLSIIEWELSGSALMRRWGPSPGARPVSFGHSLYVDHKSMVEELADDAHLSYLVNGVVVSGKVPATDLAGVEAVVICGSGRDTRGYWPAAVFATARVGR
jgi:competence protein ComGC